jgi:hypothetical protein
VYHNGLSLRTSVAALRKDPEVYTSRQSRRMQRRICNLALELIVLFPRGNITCCSKLENTNMSPKSILSVISLNINTITSFDSIKSYLLNDPQLLAIWWLHVACSQPWTRINQCKRCVAQEIYSKFHVCVQSSSSKLNYMRKYKIVVSCFESSHKSCTVQTKSWTQYWWRRSCL